MITIQINCVKVFKLVLNKAMVVRAVFDIGMMVMVIKVLDVVVNAIKYECSCLL